MNILEILKKKVSQEDMDELVLEAAAEMASNSNNGGLEEQVDFLRGIAGWEDEDILRNLGLKNE